MEELVYVLLDALIGGAALWLAAKITSVDVGFRDLVIAAGAAAMISFVPAVGWLLSIIVLFVLLKKFSRADIWPDLILMVIVSRLVSFLSVMALGGL